MRPAKRVAMLLMLLLCYGNTHAQWLKMIESSDNLYKQAKKEIELKHYQKAINLCNKAIDISPKNLDIHLLLGRAYSLANKFDSARMELSHVIEKNPKYRDAYIYLVNMEAQACNYSQGLEYADMGLKYFPNDRDLLLKKLDIYTKMGDYTESNRLAEYLFERFSNDPFIRNIYLDYKLNIARQYSHRGYIEIAKRAYEAVLEQDPLNKEALQAIFSLDVRSGNYESSLVYVNRALQNNPSSYEFMLKKISILDAMSRYVEAIEVVEKMQKLYPSNADVARLNTYVRMQAGRYYMHTDPYLQFGAVLERDPGNRDALNYIINIAYSRGLLLEALNWINVALKRYPNDRDLLTKKMGALENMKRYGAASQIAEQFYRQNRTAYTKENFVELRLLSARQYMNDREFDSAIVSLKSVLFYDPNNVQATSYLVGAYVQQKRYDEAIATLDDALETHPADELFLFKKAAVLEENQQYEEAIKITRELLRKHPENRQYLSALVEQSMAASRQSLQYDNYSATEDLLKDVLERQPDNIEALNYIINIESALKHHTTALYYTDQALHYYPDSKDFTFKKAMVYADAKNYRAAYTITGELYENNPYNMRFRNAYIDQLLNSGKQYQADNINDTALIEFQKALAITPNDTLPLYYTINALNALKLYDSALALADRGRRLYPVNPWFVSKKAVIYENQQNWEKAWLTADTLTKMQPGDARAQDYALYLHSRVMRDEMGFFYLQVKIVDSTDIVRSTNIATAQYTRRHNKGTITGRINYAGRTQGTGFQFEAETYYNHRPSWYSYAVAAYSPTDQIFPKYRIGYTLNHGLKRGYAVEAGVRYLTLQSGTVTTPMATVTKEIKDFFLSLRGYYSMIDRNEVKANYISTLFSARYYLKDNRTEFFTVSAGYGTAPDDISRNFDLARLSAYKTVVVGAGYQRRFFYRTTIGINGTWYNQQTTNTLFRNQYDLYLTLLRKF